MQLVSSNGTVLLEREKPSTKRAENSTLHVRRMSQGMKKTVRPVLMSKEEFSLKTSRPPTMPTYKKEYPTLVEDIMTECDIYSVSGRKFHIERAIWDTGADTTIISSRIVKELNLQPYKAGGISGIGGATGSNVYLVHVLVPTGDFVTQVEVMENDFQDIDLLIGMDVIVFGDFLITNKDGKTTFQFRTPSEGSVEL